MITDVDPYVMRVWVLYHTYVKRSRPYRPETPMRKLIERWYQLSEEELAILDDLPKKRQEKATTPREYTREYLAGVIAEKERKFLEIKEELNVVREELSKVLPQYGW